ncbi:histone-lysine N-methyltransferase SMYD3-like [Paramacrobiotus metropolitanus]|uniref:histone-lysine N-methyltransferase SMYD3-like n=1 Tax=Paramacrobiotus metropolitanus TaxID=2943436 RepID=UPI0024459ECC|nr:histone-lysine N-methyltransferase SMYD3-like [Paramacrobiotus metropolitanus]
MFFFANTVIAGILRIIQRILRVSGSGGNSRMAAESSAARSWTIATFPVSAGKEVMRNEPWVYSLHPRNFHSLCYRCFTPLDPSKAVRPDLFATTYPAPGAVNTVPCPDCNVVSYCSPECQNADKTTWRHGMECSLLKKLTATGTTPHHDMLIIVKIMARLLNDDGSSTRASSKPWIYSGRDYNRQLSHAEEILQNEVWMKDAQHLRHLLEAVMDEADIPDLRSLVEMYGKLKVNSFDIRDQYLRRLGEGFYFEAAKFDHSCLRNALFFFDGLTLVIRAIEDIPDALKVRVSYIELFTTTNIRQKNLEWFFFRCNCPMCHDPQKNADMECIRCCTPACPQPVPLDMDTRNRDPCPTCMEFIHTQLAQDPNGRWKDFNWHDEMSQRLNAAHKLLEEHSKQHDDIFRVLDDASATRPGNEGQGEGARQTREVLADVERRCEKMLEEGRSCCIPVIGRAV